MPLVYQQNINLNSSLGLWHIAEDESFASELSKLLEAVGDTYKASLTGDGAIAQGAGAKAVGKGGVMIGGDVSGNINTGSGSSVDDDEKKKR